MWAVTILLQCVTSFTDGCATGKSVVQDTLLMEFGGLRTPCVEHIPFDPSISEHSNSTNNAGVMPALPSPHQCALILPVY